MGPLTRKILLRALVLGAPIAVLAGCGGGDDDAPITPLQTQTDVTPQITKRQFIERADAICAEANVAIANLGAGTTDQAILISQEREITEGMVASLRAIGSPSGDQTALNAYYAAVDTKSAILGRQLTALQQGDTTTFSTLSTELSAANSEALTAAQQYGFTQCGQAGPVITPTPSDGAPAPAPAPAPDGGGDGGGGGSGGTGGGGGGGGGSGGVSPG